MSVKAYAGQNIKLLGASPLTLAQITTRNINHNIGAIYNSGSGQFSPSFAAIAGVEPEIPFDTTELARFLAAVPVLTGLAIASGNTYTGAEIYWELKKDMAGRGGALESFKNVTSKAFLVARSITCDRGGEARVSATLRALSTDGTTAPLTNSDLVTPPSAVATEKFTLGPVVVNGTTLNAVDSVTVDFGLEIEVRSEAGEPYPKWATIGKLEPRISIRTADVSQLASFPNTGTNLTSGAVVYFRKFQTSSIVYSNASTQHISVTLPSGQGIIMPGGTSASGSADATQEFEIRPLAGSSAMLAIATGVAIS